MGEDTNTPGAGGGAAAGATVVNNIDFTEVNEQLKKIAESLTQSSKAIIRDCAITLYTNTNFSATGASPIQVAKQCIANALILAKELQNQNLLD
jgi:hypothetical protein